MPVREGLIFLEHSVQYVSRISGTLLLLPFSCLCGRMCETPQTPRSRFLSSKASGHSLPTYPLSCDLCGLRSGVSKKCPESVTGVSKRCPGHSGNTLGTLLGHFLDTPEPGARRAPETPRGTLPRVSRARRVRETPVAGRGT